MIARRAGLEPVAVPVDEEGIRVDLLAEARVDAVAVTRPTSTPPAPSSQATAETPSCAGSVTKRRSPSRTTTTPNTATTGPRSAPCRGSSPVESLRGLDRQTLAPALRLRMADRPGPPRRCGAHREAPCRPRDGPDRAARVRRVPDDGPPRPPPPPDAPAVRRPQVGVIGALAAELPEATVRGIAAGLHVTVELPEGDDERAIRAEAQARRIACAAMSDYGVTDGPPTLMLGYGHLPEPAVAAGRPRAGGGDPRSPPAPGLTLSSARPGGSRAGCPSRRPS